MNLDLNVRSAEKAQGWTRANSTGQKILERENRNENLRASQLMNIDELHSKCRELVALFFCERGSHCLPIETEQLFE
jgi:hypothetical protein